MSKSKNKEEETNFDEPDFDDDFGSDFDEDGDDEFEYDFEEETTSTPIANTSEVKKPPSLTSSLSFQSDISIPNSSPYKRILLQKTYSSAEVQRMKRVREKFERSKIIRERKIIECSTVFTLFSLLPRTQYEIFLQNKNLRNVSVQVPPENEKASVTVETEPIETVDKTCQAPEEYYGLPVDNFGKKTHFSSSGSSGQSSKDLLDSNTQNVLRLFKPWFEYIELILSKEKGKEEDDLKGFMECNQWKFSNSYVTLHNTSLLQKREVVGCYFDLATKYNLLVSFSKPNEQSGENNNGSEDNLISSNEIINENGLLVVWNLFDSDPRKICVCYGELNCFCVIPSSPNIVIGGTKEGSVVLWDLDEYETDHVKFKKGKDINIAKRFPSYSSDWMVHENHRSSIIDIISIGYKTGEKNNQVLSMDEFGTIIFWLITNKGQKSKENMGMRINSVKKLTKSAVLNLGLRAYSVENEVNNSSNFIIGTGDGLMKRINRFGHPILPDSYTEKRFSTVNIFNVISYSSLIPKFFLVGGNDGSIGLYSTKYTNPVHVFSGFTNYPLIKLKWSNTNPGVFFALDSNSFLFVFDVQKKEKLIYQESVIRSSKMTGKYINATTISLPSINSKLVTGDEDNPKIVRSFIAIGYTDGRVDVHILSIEPPVSLEKNINEVREELYSFFS